MSVLGMRMIGRGRSGLETVTACMNVLPPVTGNSYTLHNHRIEEASTIEAKNSQESAASYLHQHHGMSSEEVLDITVTCDGIYMVETRFYCPLLGYCCRFMGDRPSFRL